MKKPEFKKLVEQATQLNVNLESQYPAIQRNVEQIEQATKSLVSKASKTSGDTAKTKAHFLLAGKGYDAEKLSRTLNSINLKTTFEPLEPLAEADIEGYLRHEHDMIILTAIEESKKKTVQRFEERFVANLEQEWDTVKREMFREGYKGQWYKEKDLSTQGMSLLSSSSSVLSPFHDRSVSSLMTLTTSTPTRKPTQQPGATRSAMDSKMLKYAQVVRTLNEHAKRQQPFGLITSFTEACLATDDRDTKKAEIVDCWQLLKCMLNEQAVVNGEFQGSYLHQLAYSTDYIKGTKKLRRLFIQGAKAFLEQQYLYYNQIATYPLKAMVGPVPSLRNNVKGFLNIKFNKQKDAWPAELEIVDGFPIWAQIYYCMRCGDLQAALEIAKGADARLGNFSLYLAEYMHSEDGRLQDRRWNDLIHEYKLYASRGNCDPYKLVVYNIIGKCEVSKSFSSVCSTTQDFMWLKLNMVREADEQLPPAFANYDYPLKKLQDLLLNYGPSHFNKSGRNPLLYFQVLLMSQQFELAIQYLTTVDQYFVEAVHYALSLYYYGVLRQPKQANDQLPTFDFVRMLRQYVSSFAMTDCIDALNYYCTIHDSSEAPDSPSQRNLCVKDLLLETREFDVLLGDMSSRVGQIEELLGNETARSIIELAGLDCEGNGRYEDAIRLYDLSKNYDKVLDILNNQLGRVLTVRGAERDRLVALASFMYQKYRQQVNVKDRALMVTFEQLLSLISFFDLYHSGRFTEALQLIESLEIIPFDNRTEKKAESFKLLDHSIKRNFADILLASMDLLYKLYGNIKSTLTLGPVHRDGGKEQEIRTKAKSLVVFAGTIQFRMPGDTTARLVKMEVFMA